MRKANIAFLLVWLTACGLQSAKGCPPKTAAVTADCKEQVKAGKMSKDQCYQLIEESCP